MDHQVKDVKKGTLASRLPRLTRRSPARPAAAGSPLCPPDSAASSGSGKTSSNGSGSLAGSAGTGDSGAKRFSLFRRPSFALRSKKKTPPSPAAAAATPPTMVPMRPMGGDPGSRDSTGSGCEREFSFCDESNSATLRSKSSRCSSVDSKEDAGSASRFPRGFRFPSGGERGAGGKKVKRSLSDSFARESLLSSATRGVFRSCIRPNRNSGEFDTAVMTGYRNAAVALPLLELAEETDPREPAEPPATPAEAEERERSPGVDSRGSATEQPLRFVKMASADNVCEVWSLTGSRESSVFQNIIVKTQSTSSHVWERSQAEAADDPSRAGDGGGPHKLCQAGRASAASQPAVGDARARNGGERSCSAKTGAAPGTPTTHADSALPVSPLRAQARANLIDGARQNDASRRSLPLVAETTRSGEAAAPGGEPRGLAGVSRCFYQGGSANFSALKPPPPRGGCADAPASSLRVAGAGDDPRGPGSAASNGPESLPWSVNESAAQGGAAERRLAQELHIEEAAAAHGDEAHGGVGPGPDSGGGDASYPQRALSLKGSRTQGAECLRRLSEGSEEEGAVDDAGGLAAPPVSRHRQHDDERRDRGESFASSGVNSSMDMLHSLGSLELDEDDLMLDSEHLELSLNGLSLLTGGIEPLQNPGDIRQLNLQHWTENAQRGRARTRSECSQPERADRPDAAESPRQRTSSAHAGDPSAPLPSPQPPPAADHGNGVQHARSLPPLAASPQWPAGRPRHPRSLHEPPWSSEEGLCSPEQRGAAYRHIMADCTALKTVLFRLRRVLHEEPDVSPSPATPPPAFPGAKEELDCLDKVQLLEEIERLRDKVQDQERVIERLQAELEEKGSDGGRSASVAGSFEPRPLRAERGTQTEEPTQPANMCRHPTTDTVASVADTLAATRPSEAPSEAARADLRFRDASQVSCDDGSSGHASDQLGETQLASPAEASPSQPQQQRRHASDGVCYCNSRSILIDRNGKTPRAADAAECRSCAGPRERFFDPRACRRPRAVSASAAPEAGEATPAWPPDETGLPFLSNNPERDEGRLDSPRDGGYRAGSATVVRTAELNNRIGAASPVDLQRHVAGPATSDALGKFPDFAAGAAIGLDSSAPAGGLRAPAANREPIESPEGRCPAAGASKLRDELMVRRRNRADRPCDLTQGPGRLTSSPAAGGGDLRCFSPLPGHLAEWACSEGKIADNSSGIAVSGEGNCCQLIAQDKPGFIVSV